MVEETRRQEELRCTPRAAMLDLSSALLSKTSDVTSNVATMRR